MSAQEINIGTILIDNGKLGIVVNEIKSGTWSEEPWFDWTTSYEIKYTDGDRCIMTKQALERLIASGKIVILDGKE
jgi:hypothetical protein